MTKIMSYIAVAALTVLTGCAQPCEDQACADRRAAIAMHFMDVQQSNAEAQMSAYRAYQPQQQFHCSSVASAYIVNTNCY
jgi:hypothetical protein